MDRKSPATAETEATYKECTNLKDSTFKKIVNFLPAFLLKFSMFLGTL